MKQEALLRGTLCASGFALALGACASDAADAAMERADAGGDASEGELELLTYNVAGLPQEFSREMPGVNLPKISPKLNAYDLVLSQEDFDWWTDTVAGLDFVNYHERLRADTTHEHASERHPGPEAVGVDLSLRPGPQVGDGLGYLSRFPFEDVVRVPWPRCFGGLDPSDGGAADCLAMKGFMVATFELAPAVKVDVYNLHAEAGGTADDQALQAENFEVLAELIATRSKDRAVILAGDTNLHTDGEHPDASGDTDGEIWAKFLDMTSLLDTCDVLACEDPGAIDKVAYREGVGVALTPLSRAFETDEFVDEAGEALSDHPPLSVRFRYGVRR